jgi:transcriptional regulator with XRE-family HTH domain
MIYLKYKRLSNLFVQGWYYMFDQVAFGEKLKNYRKAKNFTQEELAEKIGVSSQAVSKWEKGECLPDVYNIKLLGRFYRISIDTLLDMDDRGTEKIIDKIQIGGATFEIIEKPETILAGKIIRAKDFSDIHEFESAIGSFNDDNNNKQLVLNMVSDCIEPIYDINLSINFWLKESSRAFGFVRETVSEKQAKGVDVYKMPESIFIRAYTNKATAQLLTKEQCDIWKLFAYIRNYFMPTHGFKMAENGAQEMEVFDTAEHKSGYAYMPVLYKNSLNGT